MNKREDEDFVMERLEELLGVWSGLINILTTP